MFSREESQDPHEAELHKALQELKDDLTAAEFLRRRFAGPEYGRLLVAIAVVCAIDAVSALGAPFGAPHPANAI
jgi:hypothetical protein